jgi:membrane-bound serine protease (ClpP class)
MKPYICAVIAAVLSLTATVHAKEPGDKLVYVIPIKGEIERGLVYVIRRGVTDAVNKGADAVIFDMDTPGGRLDSTEEIIEIIDGIDVPVITFVNQQAISAGAIISLATDEIYMKPGSTIGDAMPIVMSQQEMPADRKEKMVSFVAAMVRGIAQKKGHNVDMAEAMVRIEMEFKIGKEVICPPGELLTLTSFEAEKIYGKEKKPLLSKGSVETLSKLLEKLELDDATIKTLEVTAAEKIARWIDMTAVSGLLLALGLLALYLEFKTPGFGVFGVSGLILLAVWFWGHNVAGLAGIEEVALFVVGVILLALEIFVIPGFGIAGISGIALIMASLVLAMVQHYPGGSWYPPVSHFEGAIRSLGLALAICAAGVVVLARFLPRTTLFQRITLSSALPKEEGYEASTRKDDLIGRNGTAETDLHPGGIATIDGRRQNVVSRGDFISAGSPIVVAHTKGNRIVVDKVEEKEKTS